MISDRKDTNERYAAYKDPEVAQFLIKLNELSGEIVPKYDVTQGYKYPQAEELLGKDLAETTKFLQRLADLGLLDKKVLDMDIFCPACNNANVSTNYVCPYCGSFQIQRNAIIEHLICGYIDNLKNFITENDLVCPKCKTVLKRSETRSAGRWYVCADCQKRIENLQTMHKCRVCGEKFDFNDAKYLQIQSYSISDVAKAEISNGAFFSYVIKKYFTDQNYEAHVPGKIVGSSGIQQEFDVLVKIKDDKHLAIDTMFSDEPINEQQISREYGKIFDAKIETYIIARTLNEEARKLAKTHKLNVIETRSAPAFSVLTEIASKVGIKKPKAPKKVEEKTPLTQENAEKKKSRLNFRKNKQP